MLIPFCGMLVQAGLVHAEQATSSKAILSAEPRLQALLIEEMRALQKAMAKIVAALPAGDWPTVANTAQAIHDSFILQQKLTKQDREKLHHHLPEEFIQMDQGLHLQAKKLQQVAKQHNAELSVYYVSRMLEKCMQCHSRFATQRFPSLSENKQHTPHH
jgi:hypothetical protein